MSIYEMLLRKADEGGRYRIDLNKRDLWIGRKHYIKDGEVMHDETLIDKDDLKNVFGVEIDISKNAWDVIKYLYQEYKHSIPNERWKDKSYFKALPVEELTDDELAFNISRIFGQAMLEGYILLGSMIGWIEWKDKEHWFWQDEEDENCIILRDWIERKEGN